MDGVRKKGREENVNGGKKMCAPGTKSSKSCSGSCQYFKMAEEEGTSGQEKGDEAEEIGT